MKTKELSIEQKVKAYDEALERARQFFEKPYLEDSAGIVGYIFPELKDEDEEIRKELINFFSDKDESDYEGLHPRTEIIAWLEKQGEQKPAEWSKEDERNFDVIYGIIYNSCIAEDASRLNAWLLSLRPQKQWKPSDNELEVLRLAAEKDGTCLMGLYEQLKKLKG